MAYKIKGIVPGKVYTKKFGTVDFSLPVPHAIMDELYNDGFPYLEKIEKPEVKNQKQKESPE